MWRAALFAGVVVVSACGAYGKDPSAPGGPDACLWQGKDCKRSSDCCSEWCVNWVCEQKMAKADERAGSSPRTVE